MPEWSAYWWTSITGPRNLCNAVAHALHNRSNVCLVVPDDLPWRNEMRACIEMLIHQKPDMESFYVEMIDVEDQCPDVTDIGRYLLQRYAPLTVAAGYRGREKMQKYVRANHVLDHMVIWIKGMVPEQESRWLQFCKDYAPENESDGRFVLEARWTDLEAERRNLSVIRYGDRINRHDLMLFNSIYLNRERRKYSPIWQQYVATICAQLCDTDAEISQAMMEKCDFAVEDPLTGMRMVAEDCAYQRRGECNGAHILSLIRGVNTPAIEKQTWKAQLQVLFPLIEMERVSFIERYRDKIQEALGERYYDFRTECPQSICQFGEAIAEADDAELGTIYRMTKLRRDADRSQYLLYIPDEQSRLRIELLHRLRNALAHGEPCTFDEVADFIDAHPFDWR